jgi:hypothetical protein
MPPTLTGSCLCGGIAWQAEGPLEIPHHCHCSICRRHSGTAYQTLGAVAPEGFRWLRGETGIRGYESSPGMVRTYCGRCGSKVPSQGADGKKYLLMGNLEGDPGVRPLAHIYVASKAPWWEITDSLPRFDVLPPGYEETKLPARPGPKPAAPGRIGGGCLCGAVRYELEPPIPMLRNCHCSRCRKARSAAHATNAYLPLAQFHWTLGEENVCRYKVPEARYFMQAFCGECGSPVPRTDTERAMAFVPAGSFDGDPGLRVVEHIFVGSKAPWHDITDSLPRHEAAAPAR